jgi:hypothetical protein
MNCKSGMNLGLIHGQLLSLTQNLQRCVLFLLLSVSHLFSDAVLYIFMRSHSLKSSQGFAWRDSRDSHIEGIPPCYPQNYENGSPQPWPRQEPTWSTCPTAASQWVVGKCWKCFRTAGAATALHLLRVCVCVCVFIGCLWILISCHVDFPARKLMNNLAHSIQ